MNVNNCGKVFKSNESLKTLKTHMIKDIAEKPHVCSHCGKGLIYKSHRKEII